MTKREEIINSLNACMDVHRSGLWSSGCAFCSYAKQSTPKCFMNLTKDAVALLREEPEQKHGHWIADMYDFYPPVVTCSVCGCEFDVHVTKHKYCPECGAKMDEE